MLKLAKQAYSFMQGSDKGSAQATGRAVQLQAEVTVETTRMLARNNSEVIHDSANYQVAALHSGPAYDGRIGFTKETVEVARTYCYEGLANRTSGPERVYMYPDGSSGTGSVIVADLTAAVAEEYRRPAGTSEHASALLALPESIRDGRHYADGSAIPMEDLVHLTQASWLIHPQAPAGESQVGAVEDKVRYGLARQVLATWYAQLAPLAADKAEGRDIANRYPMEILPVAVGPGRRQWERNRCGTGVCGVAGSRNGALGRRIAGSPPGHQRNLFGVSVRFERNRYATRINPLAGYQRPAVVRTGHLEALRRVAGRRAGSSFLGGGGDQDKSVFLRYTVTGPNGSSVKVAAREPAAARRKGGYCCGSMRARTCACACH